MSVIEERDVVFLEDRNLKDIYTARGYICALRDSSLPCPETSGLQDIVYDIALQCIESEIVRRE